MAAPVGQKVNLFQIRKPIISITTDAVMAQSSTMLYSCIRAVFVDGVSPDWYNSLINASTRVTTEFTNRELKPSSAYPVVPGLSSRK